MTISLQTPQNINTNSPLAALIAHFNSSSRSVQKAFVKLFEEYAARETELKLLQKIEKGEADIRSGKGFCQGKEESTEDFIERITKKAEKVWRV